MKLRPFTDEDIWRITPQPSQALDDAGRARILTESVPRGPCFTVEASDGRVLGVGGFILLHTKWATAWTILASSIGAGMVGLTRAVREEVRAQQSAMGGDARIDMHVDPESFASVWWARMLCFRQDAILPRALPDGRDMGIWSYDWMNDG